MTELFQRLANRAAKALKPEADALLADLKKRLGVPVDYSTKPPKRSRPGEPPRKDTGRLVNSGKVETLNTGTNVQASVSFATPYVRKLNDQMNRPVLGETVQARRPAVLAALRAALLKKD